MRLYRSFPVLIRCVSAFAFLSAVPLHVRCQGVPHVVISEVYGGGGNSGALYTHDFIELYNPTASDVVMGGWSVQYQGGGGSGPFTAVAKFSGTIRSHGFFLLQANPGSGGTAPLPAPDGVAAISLAASSGKIALCSDTLPVAGPSDPGVVDFVGYGSANLFEGGGAAAAPGNTTSVERKASAGSDAASMSVGGAEEHSGNGRDSDDNAADFIRRDPEPQNDPSGTEAPGGGLAVTTAYTGRWNLVSLPVRVPEPSVHAIFPAAVTPLYAWRGEYVAETAAVPGSGYWIRFEGTDTVTFEGQATGPDTILLEPGWNLLGSVSAPVPVNAIEQIPEGHIAGIMFEFDGGYHAADTLWPGRAYWVRSGGGGSVILAPPGSGAAPTPGWPARGPVPPDGAEHQGAVRREAPPG